MMSTMLAAQVLVQVVSWPLVVWLTWAGLRRRRDAPASYLAVTVLVAANAVLALDATGESALASVCAAAVQCAVAVLLAVYPDGRLVPRWIAWVVAASVAVQVANLASGLRLEAEAWWPWQYLLTWPLLLWGQFVRYRSRADARQRQQVRWVLAAFLTMITGFLVMMVLQTDAVLAEATTAWLAVLLLVLPVVGVSMGLLVPASANMDRVLRGVLTVGGWSLLVTVTVALAGLARLPEPADRWFVAAASAAVAVLGWRYVGRAAEKVVYGRRSDPLGALADLDGMLAAQHDATAVPQTVVGAITGAIGAERVEIHSGDRLLAESGDPAVTALADFPVVYRGERVATVRVAPRRGEQVLTGPDIAVVARVCAYAGPALDGARALEELLESRARTVLAREEERKRLRRYLHDDLAPTFSGLGLSAAALEQFAREGDTRAMDVARRLTIELAAATRQLREVAYDLRPPALDDRGLVAALRDRLVATGSTPVVNVIARVEGTRLPAAVEAAAYRIVSEAVLNARRHAAASLCTVELCVAQGRLEFSVADDGIGLNPAATLGVGVRSMRERASEIGGELTLTRAAGGGTVVAGWLPLTLAAAP